MANDDTDRMRERLGTEHAMAAGTAGSTSDASPHVDWPAIFAGTLFALAIGFIMMSFGSGLGLSLVDMVTGEDASPVLFAIMVGLWTTWVVVSSFMAGSYLTGRLRRRAFDATPHEVEVRDGSHGVIVWALGVLVAGMLTASGITSLAGAGVSAAESAASAVGSATSAAADAADPIAYVTDTLFRSDGSADAATEDPERMRAEVGRILTRAVESGELSSGDREYLVSLVARETGLDEAQVQARVDEAVTSVQSAADEAKAAAETARKAGILASFLTAALLIISAAAAWWASTLGGRHRDEGTDFSHITRW